MLETPAAEAVVRALKNKMDTKRFPEIVSQLYSLANELNKMFPGRHFTPDGHMVGSIGEAIASHYYGITLSKASTKGNDGACDGLEVEVKITHGKHVALRCEPRTLLVLKLNTDGTFKEVYNGSGKRVWALVAHKKMPSNGQQRVSLSRLGKLMADVPQNEKLKRKRP